MLRRKIALTKLSIKLALITLRTRFALLSYRTVSGKKVALMSAMIVLVGLAPIAVSSTIEAVKTKSMRITAAGSIVAVGVGVYWESSCTNVVSTIDWGPIEPGSSNSVVVYLKNRGNSDVTLSLETTNWNPSGASSYISLSWDYGGQVIKPGQVVPATLMLRVSSSISGITSFSFDIIITVSG